MRKLFLTVLLTLMPLAMILADNDEKTDNWLMMGGLGYSRDVLDIYSVSGRGFGNVFTALYQPKPFWGFGLDVCMSSNFKGPHVMRHISEHNTYFRSTISCGPGVYLFPWNDKRNRIHVGASAGCFFSNMMNYLERKYSYGVYEIENAYSDTEWGISVSVGVGYSYKLSESIELGIRCYSQWIQDELNVLGMLNLSFAL